MQGTLEEVLQSTQFRTSKQCQSLLRYVVDHSFAGRDELLRERVIGVELFSRPPDYDPAGDPIVRARVAEVRKRLAQYYMSVVHHRPFLRIDIPVGSYRATFAWREENTHDPLPASAQALTELLEEPLSVTAVSIPEAPVNPALSEPRRSLLKWGGLAGLVIAICALFIIRMGVWRSSPQTSFDMFWAPIFKSGEPVLIYTPTNLVYAVPIEWMNRFTDEQLESPGRGTEFGPGKTVDPQSLTANPDVFVVKQDAAAGAALVSLLTRRGKSYDMRYGRDISFGDLRSRPTILLGAFNNSWTLEMTNQLRFVFDKRLRIQDQVDTTKFWSMSTTDDYAVVSRLLNPATGGVLIAVAGIGQNGTLAAAEFLIDQQHIAELAKRAPSDWSKRNIQMVLHTKIVADTPSQTEIITVYCW